MWKIWRNMSKIRRNMKKYVNILDLALPYLYGPWELEIFRAPPSYSLWGKNSEFRPFIWALGLGKIPRQSFFLSSGTWKNSELSLYTGSGIWKNVELPLPSITAYLWQGEFVAERERKSCDLKTEDCRRKIERIGYWKIREWDMKNLREGKNEWLWKWEEGTFGRKRERGRKRQR